MNERSWFVTLGMFTSRHFPKLVEQSTRRLAKLEKAAKDRRQRSSAFPARLVKLKRKSEKEETEREATRIDKSLKFAGFPLGVEEVLASAWLAAATIAAAIFAVVAVAATVGGVSAAVYLLPLAAIAPLAAYSFIMNYPELHSKRLRVRSLGSAPEAITYMAMSLKLSPSLNKAVEFAAENTEGPLSERLRGVLWDVYTRKKESIEESFMSFANDWGEWNEDMKRSLYGLLSAAGEGNADSLGRGLERAQETIRAGARRRMEEFVASLKMPTTAFFALCVLLPLIIGTTLPVLSLGGLGVPSIDMASPPPAAGNGIQVAILLDVVFPAIAFFYSLMLLGRRPGTTGTLAIPPSSNRATRGRWAAMAGGAAAAPLFLLTLPIGVFAPIAVLWSIVLGVSTYLLLSSLEQRKRRREIRALEQQMPDAIFVIGGKLGEGLSVEQAFAKASESLKGMVASKFLDHIRFSLQLQRRGLEETLFGREGLLKDHPSRMVRVAMKMVIDLSRKDPSAAGKALIDFSHYLRDLQEVERDLKSRLGEIVEAMKSTASFFAPLVLGITAALYLLLAKSFGDIAPLPISTQSFVAALGIYLVVMVPVIANFSVGLETGEDKAELWGFLGRAWPLSLALFTAATAATVIGLGV